MGILEKIKEIEDQMSKTQVHKGTEHHLGMLKAKLAKLKREQLSGGGGGKGGGSGFSVKKAGNATVAFIGLPSVGKSTLLGALTGAKSKIAAYAFTTVTCIPGILHYKGAQIQLLDLPGIIADARSGRGRGREVMNVARTADLVLLVVDVFDPTYVAKLRDELRGLGIRMDEKPPDIVVEPASRGGLDIAFTCKQSELTEKTVQSVVNEYGIFNGSVIVRQDATVDQLIDVLSGNRIYNQSLVVVNKVDLAKKGQLDGLDFEFVPISASKNDNIDALKENIFQKLQLIRVYTKTRFKKTDLNEPMMMKTGATIGDFCDQVHRDMRSLFKYAQIWGPSAKHPGQKVGLAHVLLDGDIVQLYKR
ncbi:MAG: GTP-binding protein [Candidatus Micrarchaeota archaeon]|nr:GTP-binding protein [Candidatus Micrarchaeota archaeon]